MFTQFLFILIGLAFFINQLGRIYIGNNIAISFLDIAVALFCLWFCILLALRKVKVVKDSFVLPFIVFIGVCLCSLLLNVHHYSYPQLIVASLYLSRFILYCFSYIALRSLLKNKKAFVLCSFVITGIGLVLAGFIQYFFYSNLRNLYYLGWDDHLYRLFSTFLDPNFAGAFFCLFFLFLFNTLACSVGITKKLLLVCIGLTLIGIFLTFSRSALIMLFFSSLVYFILQKRARYFFAIIIFLFCIYFLTAPNAKIENTNYLRVASTQARVTSSSVAISIFLKNPLTGVGFNAYRYAQVHYGYRQGNPKIESHADASTDNSFLFVLATTGIMGGISFFYFHWKLMQQLWVERKKNIYSLALFSSLLGIYIDSLFINSLFYPSFLLWFAVLLAVRD